MNIKNISVPIILLLCLIFLSSCASKLFYGSHTSVTIDSDYEKDDYLNILAIGPEDVEEYNNVTLPYSIKVKNNNLPIKLNITSDKRIYESIDIGYTNKGKSLGRCVYFGGLGSGLLGGAIFGEAGLPILGIGALIAISASDMAEGVNQPEHSYYKIKSIPIENAELHPQNILAKKEQNLLEVYNLLSISENDEKYLLSNDPYLYGYDCMRAENYLNWLIEKEGYPELYFLRGMLYWKNNSLKKSHKDLTEALRLVDKNENLSLYNNIKTSLIEVTKLRNEKKAERGRMWAEVGLGLVQTGLSVYQAYEQNKQAQKLIKSGLKGGTSSSISSSGSGSSDSYESESTGGNTSTQKAEDCPSLKVAAGKWYCSNTGKCGMCNGDGLVSNEFGVGGADSQKCTLCNGTGKCKYCQ